MIYSWSPRRTSQHKYNYEISVFWAKRKGVVCWISVIIRRALYGQSIRWLTKHWHAAQSMDYPNGLYHMDFLFNTIMVHEVTTSKNNSEIISKGSPYIGVYGLGVSFLPTTQSIKLSCLNNFWRPTVDFRFL